MKLFLILAVLLVGVAPVSAQSLSREVTDEIKAYDRDLEKLTIEYQKAVLKRRAEIDQKLTEFEKDYLDKGKLDQARVVNNAKKELNPPTSIANRIDLEQSLIGKTYRWRGTGGHTWKFISNGKIESLSNGDIMPWVTLTDSEILLLQSDKTLRVLRFNEERNGWTPYFFPEPKIAGKHGGADLVK